MCRHIDSINSIQYIHTYIMTCQYCDSHLVDTTWLLFYMLWIKITPVCCILLVFWRSLFIQKWGDRNSVQICKTGLWEMGQDLWLDIREKSDKKKCPGVWAKSLDQGGFQKTPLYCCSPNIWADRFISDCKFHWS